MMEQCLTVSRFRQIPSSFNGIFAHGSPFLYLLNLEGKLQAYVKFSTSVKTVSPLKIYENDGERSIVYAICCLGNGKIVGISLENPLLKSAPKPISGKNARIRFSGSAHSCSTISGEDVSVTIAKNLDSNVCFLQARIVNNFLLVCRWSKLTGDYSLAVYLSSRKRKFGAFELPLFLDSSVATYHLSAAGTYGSSLPNDTLPYQPAILCVGVSDSDRKNHYDVLLELDIFSKLFGSEQALSKSPVLIIGCENGQVLYWSGLSQAMTNSSSSQQLLPTLYNLGQPVQSIHAVRLPKKESSQMPKHHFSVPNSLVVIGRLGKVVVCTTGARQQRLPSFVDFHVPGPITSSAIVQQKCLLFTTLFCVHRICLEEDCIKNDTVFSDLQQVTVPELRFRLPSTLAKCTSGTLLLRNICTGFAGSDSKVRVACISPSGAVTQLTVPDCSCKKNSIDVDNKNERELARELKECLQSLEVRNGRLDELKKKKNQQSVHLAELSRELSILGNVARGMHGSNSNFQANYFPKYKYIGVNYHKPCIDVCVTHVGLAPVSKGWSLLVQMFYTGTKSGPKCTSFSKLIPLASLQPNDKVSTQIIVEDFEVLQHKVCCYLCYDASHLVHKAAVPTTATVLFSQESFDLIDFLLPLKVKPQQVPWRQLIPSIQPTNDDDDEFPHYKDIIVPPNTVTNVIATQENVANLPRVFLDAFLAKQELIEMVSDTEPNTSDVTMNSYDGNKLCLQTSVEKNALVFSVYSTSEIILREAVHSIQSRLAKYT